MNGECHSLCPKKASSCLDAERCIQNCNAYGRVCPLAARKAAQSACEAVRQLKDGSRLFVDLPDFTFINPEDVVIGDKLGTGGFCSVHQCVVCSGPKAGQEAAIKYLRRNSMVELHHFKHGASDLVVEAYFLHALSHRHIVTLHGMTQGSVETNVAAGREHSFFIVIDRLYDTLEHRIERWAEDQEKHAGNALTRWSHDFKERKRAELMERVRVAWAVADAMEYLHGLNIIYRDLKPDNIGFDKAGVLKLFDFGLAKELRENERRVDGTYDLTGNTGSRRYMAPEVAMEEPYDQSVDVYSFGILLWEICSAEKPFHGYSSGKHMEEVVLGGDRPKLDPQHASHWPLNLQWLMKRCWSASPRVRPSFTLIKQVLKDVLDSRDSLPEGYEHELPEEPRVEELPAGGFGSLFRGGAKGHGRSKSTSTATALDHAKSTRSSSDGSSTGHNRSKSSGGYLSDAKDGSGAALSPRSRKTKVWGFGLKR